MGGGGSKQQVQTTGTQKNMNKSIEERIQKQRAKEKNMVKVLLLGAGECGKSTILKQMKILHTSGFTEEEEKEATQLVYKNTLDSIQSIIGAIKDLQISWDAEPSDKKGNRLMDADGNPKPNPCSSEELQAKAANVMAVDSSDDIPLSIKDDITAVWSCGACHEAKRRENEFHLLDSAAYFLDKVQDYFVEGYKCSTQDSLRTRLTTTGIIETEFVLEDTAFKMYDVGGQRGERKKWIHCFDDVTAIMFIASLSEYNQVLAEDRTKNRLDESLDLFDGIANLPWFENASVILFLNKNDLFEEKIIKFDIREDHPEYPEDYRSLNYEDGLKWITDEYKDRSEDEEKELYTHVTDATNTENVSFVWQATQHIILSNKLQKSGLAM